MLVLKLHLSHSVPHPNSCPSKLGLDPQQGSRALGPTNCPAIFHCKPRAPRKVFARYLRIYPSNWIRHQVSRFFFRSCFTGRKKEQSIIEACTYSLNPTSRQPVCDCLSQLETNNPSVSNPNPQPATCRGTRHIEARKPVYSEVRSKASSIGIRNHLQRRPRGRMTTYCHPRRREPSPAGYTFTTFHIAVIQLCKTRPTTSFLHRDSCAKYKSRPNLGEL